MSEECTEIFFERLRCDERRGFAAQKRPAYENDRHEKGVKGC